MHSPVNINAYPPTRREDFTENKPIKELRNPNSMKTENIDRKHTQKMDTRAVLLLCVQCSERKQKPKMFSTEYYLYIIQVGSGE